jgi:type II secretory ATPase GspE/PulE/Tfp pilus assembly ATPase PilB-like protein
MLLITGPTGSGKTSTLYAALGELVQTGKNIVTIEDPVEYAVPGVNQGQTNDKAGFTFARGLRALLRQDPDVIMVGEVRDSETLEVATEASLTGHLVFSTLHTNSAVGTLTPPGLRALFRNGEPASYFRGQGCHDCRGTGFRGRVGIFEVLRMTDAITELVLGSASEQALHEAARAGGMVSLREECLSLVRRGETTLEEVLRVTHDWRAAASDDTRKAPSR